MERTLLQNLFTIVDKALALEPGERNHYLNEVCGGDTVLREEVDQLLGSTGESENFWEGWKQWNKQQMADLFQDMGKENQDLTDQQFGHYLLLERLGTGGMGVVYRGRDTRLERDVAIKILTQGMPGSFTSRVLHEARAASALNHPNIVTIHEVGKHGDTDFIVMEYVNGETLDAVIRRGPPEMEQTLKTCTLIADGLAAAHAKGLVHRDIKPANVMVTPAGQVKILDFGVARQTRTADGRDLTETVATATEQSIIPPGAIVGTLGYLAPELLEGGTADTRSDVFALGVTLYQLISGKQPFEGDADVAVIASTLRDEPPTLTKARPDVPSELARIVERCLAQRPEDRYASAGEVARELAERKASIATDTYARLAGKLRQMYRAAIRRHRAVVYTGAVLLTAVAMTGLYVLLNSSPAPVSTTETEMTSPRFLAVLPFANTSPDPGNEYFADGVTDDVLAHLAQVPDFSVISRTTMMSYKGSGKSIPEITEELGVGYVLEGSVRRAGDRVRITARLVDGRTDQHLWADAYDRELQDIFTVQTEIARAIVEALEVQLSSGVAARMERPPTQNMGAYDLFLLGRESHYRRNLEGTERAMEQFGRALERDPEFTLARAWLARSLVNYSINHGMGDAWADSAVAMARQAVAEQPDLSDAYMALGTALTVTGRHEEAVAALERALALNPNDWQSASTLGTAYIDRGRWDEAIRITRRALDLEGARMTSLLHQNLAWYSLHLGLLDQAEAAIEPALTFQPDNPYTHYVRAWIDLMRGDREAALLAAEHLAAYASEVPSQGLMAVQLFVWLGELERAGDIGETVYIQSPTIHFDWYLLGVPYAYALEYTGRYEHAHRVLAETERYARKSLDAGNERRAFRYSLAGIHALLGETDEAFHWLNEAIDFGWNAAPITASDPILENLRSDPRFQPALDRMERSLAPMRERVEQEGW